jgi:putative Mn2+ efflux pump MntP
MITVFILGILGGLDNLQIGSAFGLMGLRPERRWLIIAPFALCDAGMTFIGLLIGHKLNTTFENIAQWLGSAIMMTLGLYTLARELLEKEKQDLINNKWLLAFLPLLLSFDNLFAGLGLGTSGYPVVSSTLIAAVCSGAMCLLGLMIGEKMRHLIPKKIEIISCLYLIGLAVFLAVRK